MQKKPKSKNKMMLGGSNKASEAEAQPVEQTPVPERPITDPPYESDKVLILGDVLVTGEVEVETVAVKQPRPKTAAEIRAAARVAKWGRK